MASHDDENDRTSRPTHDGTRGPTFRTFKRDFLTIARGKFAKDDRFSFYQAYMRTDEGGTGTGAPPMPAATVPAAGGGTATNPAFMQATLKKTQRNYKAFVALYEAFTPCPPIQQLLSDLADDQPPPAELAAEAWDLIESECDDPDDDLELSKQNTQFCFDSVCT